MTCGPVGSWIECTAARVGRVLPALCLGALLSGATAIHTTGDARAAVPAQQLSNIEILAEHGGEVTAVVADAHYVYAALGSRLVVLPSPDRAPGGANADPWTALSTAPPEGQRLRALAVPGPGLLVAATEGPHGRLLVYQIDESGEPERVGALELRGRAGPMVARGSHAWIGVGEVLWHVDLGSPDRPRMRLVFGAERAFTHLALAGTVLLAATEAVTGPPRPVGSRLITLATAADGTLSELEHELRPGEVTGLAADDSWVAIIENDGLLALYHHEDGRNRTLRSQRDSRSAPVLANPSRQWLQVAFGTGRLWLARPGHLLTALEPAAEPDGPLTSMPLSETELTALSTTWNGSPLLALGITGLAYEPWVPGRSRMSATLAAGHWLDVDGAEDGTAWAIRAADGESETRQLHHVRITDTHPVASLARAASIANDGRWLYAFADGRLWRWDIADPDAPRGPLDLGFKDTAPSGRGADTIAGATGGRVLLSRQLLAIDEAGVEEIHQVRFLNSVATRALTAEHAWGVVSASMRTIRLMAMDARDASRLQPGLILTGRSQVAALAVAGDLAVAAGTSPTNARDELTVLSAIDPAHPRVLGVIDLTGSPQAPMAFAPPFAWLMEHHDGLMLLGVFDLGLPSLPDAMGQVSLGATAVALDAVGDRAWLATADGRLLAFRVRRASARDMPSKTPPSPTPTTGPSPMPSATPQPTAATAAPRPAIYLPRCTR